MGTCKRVFLFGTNQRCARPATHLGLHRDTVKIRRFETTQWGDNESKTEED